MWNVLGSFLLLPPSGMPVLVFELFHYFFLPIEWTDDGVKYSFYTLQCNMFNSETHIGVTNVNVTNGWGKRHYAIDKYECSEVLKQNTIGTGH